MVCILPSQWCGITKPGLDFFSELKANCFGKDITYVSIGIQRYSIKPCAQNLLLPQPPQNLGVSCSDHSKNHLDPCQVCFPL